MKIITTTAHGAGACASHAQSEPAAFQPVLRRDLLRALRKCRSRLGLSTGDVLVLDTLLSFLPCRDRASRAERPIEPGTMLVVYASNRTICDRANGMDERVLRRHVSRLVQAGLLARRDSATGKRFPLKSGGRVTTAFGLDLTPLLLASANIADMARQIESEEEEFRSLRSRTLALRAELLRQAEELSAEALAFVDGAKTLLRRTTLGLKGVNAILDRLLALVATPPCPTPEPRERASAAHLTPEPRSHEHVHETEKESAGNGQNVRQVESLKKDTNKTAQRMPQGFGELWEECKEVAALFPDVPRQMKTLREITYRMGSYLGICEGRLARVLSLLDWDGTLRALDYLAAHSERISNPAAYLEKLARAPEFASRAHFA